MKRAWLAILHILCLLGAANGQSKGGVDQYHYIGANQQYTYMPVLHYQTNKNWYSEARYNYEDLQTVSLYVGKTFTGTNRLSYSLTPMLGGVMGKFNGFSTGLNVDMTFDKFFFSTQAQYSFSTNNYNPGFLYNWSEVGYQGLKWLYAGLSIQQTHTIREGSTIEKGILIGFSFKNYTIPIYTFDPLKGERYFIVGINYLWESKKATKSILVSQVQ
jgi:hypothetical protein